MMDLLKKIDKFCGHLADLIIYIVLSALLIYFIREYYLPYQEGKYKFYIDYNEQHK